MLVSRMIFSSWSIELISKQCSHIHLVLIKKKIYLVIFWLHWVLAVACGFLAVVCSHLPTWDVWVQ